MPMCDALTNGLLKLLLNATTFANIAINATSSPITDIYMSGHTADPGTSGDQTTSEVGYTLYARVAVARNSGGWTITGNVANPTSLVSFPTGSGGSGTITFIGLGKSISGTGTLLMRGAVTPNIVTGNGITPQIPATSTITFT